MAKTRFGLSCALTTPVGPDGAVDLVRLATHARRVIDRGCDTVTLFGTTGEGAALGDRTRERMIGAAVAGGVPAERLYAGVANSSLEGAVGQGRAALEAGARGLLVAPPFYFKDVGDEGLYAWFSRFVEGLGAGARGIFLYHIPQVTAVKLSPALVGRLKRAFPGVIAGVKDSECNWATTEAFLAEHRDLAILVGDERLLARAVRAGAEGSICGVANIAPEWLRPVVDEGKDDPRVTRLVEAIVAHPVSAAVKALTGHVIGDPGFGPMLPPLTALPDPDRRRLFATADAILRAEAA